MPLDADDLKKMGDAIAAALKTHGEAQAGEVGKLVDAKLKPIQDEIEARKVADKAAADKAATDKAAADKKAREDAGKNGNGAGNGAASPEVEELRRRLDEQEQTVAKEKAAIAKEREDNARSALRASAKAALEEAGVSKSLADGAVLVLEANGVITATKEGKAAFKSKDKYGADVLGEGKAGATTWLGTDTGKAYLPPKAGAGTGDGAGGPQRGANAGNAPRNKDGSLNWGAMRSKLNADALAGDGGQTVEVPDR